jgi:hypothetical protein
LPFTHWARIHISVKLTFLSGHKSSLFFPAQCFFQFLYVCLSMVSHNNRTEWLNIWYACFLVFGVSFFK